MADEVDTGTVDAGTTADAPPQSTADAMTAEWEAAAGEIAQTKEPTPGQTRDELGRFAGKQAEEAAAAAAAGTPAPAGQQAAAPTQAAPATDGKPAEPGKIEFPHYWSPEDRAVITKAPPEVQAWLVNRERMIEGLVTRKTQELADLKRPYEAMQSQLAPFAANAKAAGYDLTSAAVGLLSTEHELRTGSQERKQQIVGKIISDYGIDISGMAAQAADTKPFVDPTIQPLQQELAELKQWRQAQEAERAQQVDRAAAAEQARAEQHVLAFRDERGAEGQLLRPHMAAVLNEMMAFMNIPGTSLQGAYEKAIWANDTLRTQEIARQRQAEEDQRVAEAKAAAAKARTSTGFQAVRPGAPASQPAALAGAQSTAAALAAEWERQAAG